MLAVEQDLNRREAVFSQGQGSQKIGMGQELAQLSPAAARVWQESDDALFTSIGFKFSELAWRGTLEELTKTENAQPAIIIDALAKRAAIEEAGGLDRPYWNTGHSVGLIVALVASEAIDAKGAVQLAEARGRAFKFAVDNTPSTTMMAVQNDKPEIVTQVVRDLTEKYPLSVCLLNTNNQVVLGGEVRDIKEADAYIKKADPATGELVRVLTVDAAFHSRFMEPGVPIYQEAVEGIDIRSPRGGLIAGSTVEPLQTPQEIRRALVAQLTNTERWRDVINFLVDQGVDTMTELGEKPVLSDMNRRIAGGSREKIILPNIQSKDGKEITIGWRWHAPIKEEPQAEKVIIVPPADIMSTRDVEAEAEEAKGLLEKYAEVDDMDEFLELPTPKGYEATLNWYKKWTSIRTGNSFEDMLEDGNFVDDLGLDSLDYSVLRADVKGTFGRLVPEDEAKDNVTPALAAKATYKLLNAA